MQIVPLPASSSRTAPEGGDARLLDLAEHAAEPNPFYHPALLLPALAHMPDGARARLLVAERDGRLIAALPVMAATRHGRLPLANITNWVHPHCFLGTPLLRAGEEEDGWADLLAQLDDDPASGGFLHLLVQHPDGAAMRALGALCARQKRAILCIGSYERALLDSPLEADAYWQAHVRAKKRKELRRLVNRLEEMGQVRHRRLADMGELAAWTEDFLALEGSGWKGRDGTAIASDPATRRYVCAALEQAARAGMIDMLRIDMDGRAIAMLVNLRHARGGFSYKIAIDEDFARFSPGVLIELDNLHMVQGEPGLDWMDSCAMPGHAMIDSLWGERRRIGQYRVALRGRGLAPLTRAGAFHFAGAAERASRLLKGAFHT